VFDDGFFCFAMFTRIEFFALLTEYFLANTGVPIQCFWVE
jgi:hypothetical protein